jgi:hypothetical protein
MRRRHHHPQVEFPAKKKIGITFRRHNEWAVVKVVPAGSDIVMGSLLAAVNGQSVLLKKFDDSIQCAAKALTSGTPFTITFLLPYRLEGSLKKYETRRMGSGWKTYHFALNCGILQCFAKQGGRLKYEWDLANETQHQTLLTLCPRSLLAEGDMGIMLVKGGEKVMLKAEDSNRTRTWGSFLYLAMTVANGGNPEMFDLEAQRIKAKDPRAAAPDMSAMLEQAALQEKLAAAAAARDAQVAAQAAQAAQAEADQLAKDAADAAEGDLKAAAEAAAAVAAVKAAAAAQLGKEEAEYAAKAESFSRRASLTVSMMAMQVRTQSFTATMHAQVQNNTQAAQLLRRKLPTLMCGCVCVCVRVCVRFFFFLLWACMNLDGLMDRRRRA